MGPDKSRPWRDFEWRSLEDVQLREEEQVKKAYFGAEVCPA